MNTFETSTILTIVLAVVLMAGMVAVPYFLRPRSKNQ